MQTLSFDLPTPARLAGTTPRTIVGVVASGNLEILFERDGPDTSCRVEVATPVRGFDAVWRAVVEDFVARKAPGGLRISINDGGARPDAVSLRLLQGCALMEAA